MSKNQPPKKSEPEKKKKSYNAALKYSGMAFQMVVAIGIGVFLGGKLDSQLGSEDGRGIFTALGAILGLAAAFYLILKDLK